MEFQYGLSDFIPFKDAKECERVRKIKKEDIAKHHNPDFKIKVIEDPNHFYIEFALDLVSRIKKSAENNEKLV